ncbi:hypothetical protein KIH39_10005 [Telmatocola sphagniphila]|uniref:Uncharacterized protein n=1 Tax=Telmatocola sphagniphila TaxID=1123043 RepID=A0A8E6B9I5_9BACT|nr:hypothetical protein [Telmatocola sphagniphila]QVL34216.1 hypothetical protein KIH39_10005 [Telmatocola sphagniphila]
MKNRKELNEVTNSIESDWSKLSERMHGPGVNFRWIARIAKRDIVDLVGPLTLKQRKLFEEFEAKLTECEAAGMDSKELGRSLAELAHQLLNEATTTLQRWTAESIII